MSSSMSFNGMRSSMSALGGVQNSPLNLFQTSGQMNLSPVLLVTNLPDQVSFISYLFYFFGLVFFVQVFSHNFLRSFFFTKPYLFIFLITFSCFFVSCSLSSAPSFTPRSFLFLRPLLPLDQNIPTSTTTDAVSFHLHKMFSLNFNVHFFCFHISAHKLLQTFLLLFHHHPP